MDCGTRLAFFSPRDSFLRTLERVLLSSVREIGFLCTRQRIFVSEITTPKFRLYKE